MKLNKYLLIVTIISLPLLSGCGSVSNVYPEGDFKIMVLSDIHLSNDESKEERLKNLIQMVNENEFPGLEIITATGDNVSSVYDKFYPEDSSKGYNRLEKLSEIFGSFIDTRLFNNG